MRVSFIVNLQASKGITLGIERSTIQHVLRRTPPRSERNLASRCIRRAHASVADETRNCNPDRSEQCLACIVGVPVFRERKESQRPAHRLEELSTTHRIELATPT
jgi:hypothetical protein